MRENVTGERKIFRINYLDYWSAYWDNQLKEDVTEDASKANGRNDIRIQNFIWKI
jgi:hypothetical protein